MKKFEIGQTVYYTGRKDYISTSVQLRTGTAPEKVTTHHSYNESEGEMTTGIITEIVGRGHQFGRGFFLTLKLDNGSTISSFDCFDTVEEYYRSIEESISVTTSGSFDNNITFPIVRNISAKLLSDDLISIQPMQSPL